MKLDYIITHSIDAFSLNNPNLYIQGYKCDVYEDNMILNWFEDNIKYKHWYFGHYHLDVNINDNKTCLYHNIQELK